jgi:hypothetical protein
MAVAASYGSFVVYALKPMSQLQDEVKSSDGSYAAGFKPIKEVGRESKLPLLA